MGIKTGVLQSPHTICIVLSAHHHTGVHVHTYKILHENTWYFHNLVTLAIIPTNSLSSPSSYTTQGSLPPYLHWNPSGSPTCLLGLQHNPDRKSRSFVSRNSNCTKIVFVHLFTNVHWDSFKICINLWALFLHGLLMLPRGIFKTIVGPLDLYQDDGLIPEHFEFPVQDAHQIHLKVPFMLHLDHNLINHVVRIRNILI